MSYVSDILKRSNLKEISYFLLYGFDDLEADNKSRIQRQNEAADKMHKIVEEAFPDPDEKARLLTALYDYILQSEQIYVEAGMCSGASLIIQLLIKNK